MEDHVVRQGTTRPELLVSPEIDIITKYVMSCLNWRGQPEMIWVFIISKYLYFNGLGSILNHAEMTPTDITCFCHNVVKYYYICIS